MRTIVRLLSRPVEECLNTAKWSVLGQPNPIMLDSDCISKVCTKDTQNALYGAYIDSNLLKTNVK